MIGNPILRYLQRTLNEYSIPLEDMAASIITADWLLEMLMQVQTTYKLNDDIR